ncbi:hypothetical protein CYMTET_3522 [Cymbomonas tetramitiformis]|uniref:Uncharacterized protein n=1 Tax=Cymbomonas tetramitiformis TaxID=36881 RepID=A0AAE0LKY9_9CHLO|nr:hypothetical protein CYMTET_3522 [Cymbomonas tetramitiformis]
MGVTTRAKKSLTRDSDIDASLRLIDGVRNSPTVRTPTVPTPKNPASNEDADVAVRRYLQEQAKLTDEIYKARLHRAWAKSISSRLTKSEPRNFNPKNFMAEKKIKSRTFVDLFAAGSEINQNLKPVLESRFGKDEFKFISVDSDTQAKNVKGWVPMNIFSVDDNWKLLGQNSICAPPPDGVSDAAIMYFAEHCKDFCAYLVPEMWLADRAYPLRRMWWAKRQEEKLIYEIEGVRGMRWIVCVKEKRKGNDLFAKTSVKLSVKPGLEKAYAERKQAAQSASSNGEDALEDALRNDAS